MMTAEPRWEYIFAGYASAALVENHRRVSGVFYRCHCCNNWYEGTPHKSIKTFDEYPGQSLDVYTCRVCDNQLGTILHMES